MLVTEKCFSFRNLTPYLPVKKHAVGSNCKSFITLAKKKDLPETSSAQQQNEKPIFPIKVSNLILSRAAVAVLGLGFIDAGYVNNLSSFSFFFLHLMSLIDHCFKFAEFDDV